MTLLKTTSLTALCLLVLCTILFATPGFLNNSCGTINESGTYIVNVSNITSQNSNTCINITASHVLLNLNSSYIEGALNPGASIYAHNSSVVLTNITIANGTANNSFHGIHFNSIENSTIRNVTVHGITTCSVIFLNNSRYNTITNITGRNALGSCSIANGDGTGVYLLNSSRNNITNSTLYNLTKGIMAYDSLAHNNTISYNTIYNTNRSGILIDTTIDSIVSYNYIYNQLDAVNGNGYGIYVLNIGDGSNTFSYNNLSNMSQCFRLYYPGQASLSWNRCYNSEYGFMIMGDESTGSSYQNNTVINVSAGFVLTTGEDGPDAASTNVVTGFSGNNITNATTGALALGNSSLSFSGNNGIYSLPLGSLGVYSLSDYTIGSNFTTNGYNITTSNMNYQLTSYNVSVKIVNLSKFSLTTVSTISGVSMSSGKVVSTFGGPNYLSLNATNTSNVASITLKLFYNSSDLGSYSTDYLGIGSTTSGGTWTYYSATVNTSESSVYYTGITSFSYFAPLVYAPASSSPQSSGDSPAKSLEIEYDFTCLDGSLEVSTTKGAEVSLVELSPIYLLLEKKEADSEGNALFTITEDGTYKIRATKSGYTSAEEENLEFNLCGEETPEEDGEEPEPEPQPEQPPEQLECNVDSDCEEGYECTDNNCVLVIVEPPTTPDDSQTEVLEEINNAQQQLDQAKKQGKEVTEAQKKLDEAKEAYEEGDYEKAKRLTEQSLSLVKSEDKKSDEPKPIEPREPEEQHKNLADFFLIVGSAVVVIIVLVAAYFFLRKQKKSDGYKFKK